MSGSTDTRTTEQRLSDEAARWRRALREEEARHSNTAAVLRETNRWFLRAYLRERMADPHDFEVYVTLQAVLDDAGAIVWERVDLLVNELLAERPHLAAPTEPGSLPRVVSAVRWLTTGT